MALVSTSVVNNNNAGTYDPEQGAYVTKLQSDPKVLADRDALTYEKQKAVLADMRAQNAASDVKVAGLSSSIDAQLAGMTGASGGLVGASLSGGGGASDATSAIISGNPASLVGGVTSSLSGVIPNNLMAGLSNGLSGLTAGLNSGLSGALSSITSTFSSSPFALASGLDGVLSGIFKDTNVKTAASIITGLSDPIKTNLLGSTKKTPVSTMFKVSSLEAGSQTVTSSGSSSTFGTKAPQMVGTSLSTVLGRFNLDSAVTSLGSALTSSKATQALGSLFSDPTKLVKQVVSGVTTLPGGLTTQGVKAFANDVSALIGKTSALSSSTGKSVLDYVITDPTKSLVNSAGTVCSVSPDADATAANQVLSVARQLGCATLNGVDYSSTTQDATLYNYAVNQAADMGLTDLLDQLLGCDRATSDTGQLALSTAFASTSGSDIGIASTILNKIATPLLLKTDGLSRRVVSNPRLTASDVGQVEGVLTKLGTSASQTMCVNELYDPTTPVYDYSLLGDVNESFRDAAVGNNSLSLYISPNVQVLKGDGLSWA